MSTVVYGKTIQKNCMLKRVGGITFSNIGLQEYVNYSIQIRAYTREGPGPYSNPIIELTLEDSKFRKLNLLF